jgi:hypothetical protein
MTPSDTTVTAKTDKTTPGRFRQAPNHRLKRSHARSGLAGDGADDRRDAGGGEHTEHQPAEAGGIEMATQ